MHNVAQIRQYERNLSLKARSLGFKVEMGPPRPTVAEASAAQTLWLSITLR